MKQRPKVGLFFLGGESWWDAGVCDAQEGPFAGFLANVEADTARATEALARHFDVVSSGLLHSKEEAIRESRRFDDADVDAIVFCPIIWTNDPPVVAFIQEARRAPLMLWAYDPYAGLLPSYKIEEWLRSSGPVSVQQSANIFRRFGWDYEVLFGNENDPQTMEKLSAFVRASAVVRGLRGTRIAVLPSPCRVVMSTWVDEFHLLERFGVELTYIPVEAYGRMVRDVPSVSARTYVNFLKSNYPVVGVADEELSASAQQALAMVRLAEEYGFSGIALEDFDAGIYEALGFRPHLAHPRMGEIGCTVGMEADILGVLATIIVSRLASRMGMFNEFFSLDRAANTVLMGHPGQGELSFGDPATFMVTRDLEFDPSQPAGAWISYRAKAGEMTFLNLTPEYGQLKAAAFTGREPGGPRMMEGYSHMLIQPDSNAAELFENIVKLGLLQHWGTVHGRILPELRFLAKQLNLQLREL